MVLQFLSKGFSIELFATIIYSKRKLTNLKAIIAQQERRINITFSLNTDIEYRHYIEVIPLYADIRIYPQDKTITVPIGYFEIHSERSTSLIPSDYHKKEGFYTGYTE